MSEDHAGVRFPPPFIYLSFLVAGLLLSRVRPLTVVPASYATVFGIAFIVVAIAVAVAGFRELRRHETTVRPDQPSSTIVNSGPYRFTRNPLYLSLATLYLGIGLWTNSLWVILLLVPLLFVMTRQVIAREEAYLERAFGDTHLNYKSQARRWLYPQTISRIKFRGARSIVIVYRSGLTKGTGVLSGARRIDVTMSITRIPL